MQRHDCRIVTLFEANARQWAITGECSLFEMECIKGCLLELGTSYELILKGRDISLGEQGLLIRAYMLCSTDVIEYTHNPWAFPNWLQHLESTGISSSLVIGSFGVQALEWHEHYLQWAHVEECAHLKHLISQGTSLDEIELWYPELYSNPLATTALEQLTLQDGLKKRTKGRPSGSMSAAIRELYALAVDIYRHEVPGVSDSWLAACWEACRLRPNWVPKAWAVKSGTDEAGNKLGPGMSLYRATNKKTVKSAPLSDPINYRAPEHWAECRPDGWRGLKSN